MNMLVLSRAKESCDHFLETVGAKGLKPVPMASWSYPLEPLVRDVNERSVSAGDVVDGWGTLSYAVGGGGGGIRTHGRLPFTRFPSVPIRPLSHSSESVLVVKTNTGLQGYPTSDG